VFVYYGGPIDNFDCVADLVFKAPAESTSFGSGTGLAGDLNSDGWDDLLVGANAFGGTGRAYLFYGGSNPDSVPDFVFDGEYEQDYFGIQVAGGGDLNGDGWDDLAISATGSDACQPWGGRVYVHYGGPILDTIPDFTIDGCGDPLLGSGLAIVPDAGDNNVDDLLIGAPGFRGSTALGTVMLFSIAPQTPCTRYVSKVGANTPPYLTPATAANSIQAAIDVSDSGDVICVGGSFDAYEESVTVDEGVVLRGTGGTALTRVTPPAGSPNSLLQATGVPDTVTVCGLTFDGEGSTLIGLDVDSTITLLESNEFKNATMVNVLLENSNSVIRGNDFRGHPSLGQLFLVNSVPILGAATPAWANDFLLESLSDYTTSFLSTDTIDTLEATCNFWGVDGVDAVLCPDRIRSQISGPVRFVPMTNAGHDTCHVAVGVEDRVLVEPDGIVISQNQPNPFSSATRIAFNVPWDGARTRLDVFDVRGARLAVLLDAPLTQGRHIFAWDGRDSQGRPLASGVYFCRVTVDDRSETKRMTLIR
jgi:hypothetical protein